MGQTGVSRPVSQGCPVVCYRKLTERGNFAGTPAGCPKNTRPSRGLVAPHRAILRYYRCDAPYYFHIARYFSRELALPQNGAIPTTWHLVSHRHISAIPHFATSHRTSARCLAQNIFAILTLQTTRNMKSIVAGPLSPGCSQKIVSVIFPYVPFLLPEKAQLQAGSFPDHPYPLS